MSATVTGVCGFSWEVTMSVLPRLYFEEVQSELRRRKIAVGREKVLRHSELIHLLHEIMVCEYQQLQQHLRGNTGSEHSPQTRTQDGASDGQGGQYAPDLRGNWSGIQGCHGNTSQNSPNQGTSPKTATQQKLQAQRTQHEARHALQGNLPRIQGCHGNSSQSIVQNSPNQGMSPRTATQQTLQAQHAQHEARHALRGNMSGIQGCHDNSLLGIVQNSTNQSVSPITATQQNLQAQHAQTAAKYTSPENLRGIQGKTSQSVAQNSPNQVEQGTSPVTATQQILQAQFAQNVANLKNNSPGNLQGIQGNTSQSAQNSPNLLVQGNSPITPTQQNLQAQFAQNVAKLKNNLPGMMPSNMGTHIGGPIGGNPLTSGQPNRLLMQVSPQTQVTSQAVPPPPAQMIRNGLTGITKFPNTPVDLLRGQENPVVKIPSGIFGSQPSPQPPRSGQVPVDQVTWARTFSTAMRSQPEVVLTNTPQGLQKGVVNNGLHGSTASSHSQVVPVDQVTWAQSLSSVMKSQQQSTTTVPVHQGLQKGVVTSGLHSSTAPSHSQDVPVDQVTWARSFSSAMRSQPNIVSARHGLQRGVVTNGCHSSTAPGVVYSSPTEPLQGMSPKTATLQQNQKTQHVQTSARPDQLVQGTSPKTATIQQNLEAQHAQASARPHHLVQGTSPKTATIRQNLEAQPAQSVANNSLPGTCARMPADIHIEQGNVSKSNVPHTSFPLLPQTLQATIIQGNVHGNTSPYMVGQANLMLEPTEARIKKPDHQNMQEMLSANNSNSFQSAATSAEREKDAHTNRRQTNTHTQASVATQQTLPTLNQQSAPENSGKTSSDSLTQQSQEQDCTQSIQDNESSVQGPCETDNSSNPPENVVVKIEPDDDYWTVPCTTSSTNNDNDHVSGVPSLPVVKTEEDDSVETGSILPLDYSARSSLEEESMVETEDNTDSEELSEERVDHASPERSQAMTATPVQQDMPQSLLMIHTEQHDSTSTATPLTGGTTSSQDLEDGHFSHVGFLSPDFSSYVSTFRDTRKQQSQKRKTVRALLEDLKKAKQLKSDGLTDNDDPMGIVSAMKDWREGRRPSQTSRREDEGSFAPPGGEVLAQRSGNVQVQGQEGPSPQFHLASTESDMKLRALRGVVHKCMFCPFETRLKTNLQCHLRDHAEINVYRCAMCSFSAAAKQTLDDHVATQHHEELPFMCGVCGYRTGVKENLSTHMWVVHKAGQSFQCSLCEYSTSYKTRLETHMINHHF